MARKRRVTATDVAKEAGVSQTTVSYVLNNAPNQKISPETRQRIQAAVKKLGYTPSAAARTLRLGRSSVVLLLLADLPMGYTAIELVENLTQVLRQEDLTVITRIDDGRSDGALWEDLAPCAVVIFAPISAERRARLRASGIQMIDVWPYPGDAGDAPLTRSQIRVGRLQAQHLVQAGHQRLGYAAPDDPRQQAFYEPRLHGVQQVCADRGLAPPVVREIPLDTASAAAAARLWRADGVTAVCAYNDEVAFALLSGMHTAGLSAPQGLAVIGVDDIPVARFSQPPLTTINHRMDVTAAELAGAVLSSLQLPPSVAPPRQGEAATVVVRRSA